MEVKDRPGRVWVARVPHCFGSVCGKARVLKDSSEISTRMTWNLCLICLSPEWPSLSAFLDCFLWPWFLMLWRNVYKNNQVELLRQTLTTGRPCYPTTHCQVGLELRDPHVSASQMPGLIKGVSSAVSRRPVPLATPAPAQRCWFLRVPPAWQCSLINVSMQHFLVLVSGAKNECEVCASWTGTQYLSSISSLECLLFWSKIIH